MTSCYRRLSPLPRPLRPYLLFPVFALLALCVSPSPVAAQVLYGSIVGNVTDSTGAAVPGATVTIEQTETKLTRELVTDTAGAYHFTAVPSGTYTISVSMTGFRKFGRPGVAVTLNSVARVDAKLEVGQLAETVSVTAESSILQTDRAEVRSELKAIELTNLPVPIGRNYQQLFKTLPGFTPPADAHSIPSNPSRALVFNVNGASDSSNNTRIDGVSTTNIWLPHVAAYVPALESLETVNVVTNSFDAEQGLAGGSAINVQIKSGTNQLRGSAFEVLHERADARAELLRARRHPERGLGLSPVWGNARRSDPCRTSSSTLAAMRARVTSRTPPGRFRCRPTRCAAATCPSQPRPSTIRRPERERHRAHALFWQHHSGQSHRSNREEDHRPDAVAEPAG